MGQHVQLAALALVKVKGIENQLLKQAFGNGPGCNGRMKEQLFERTHANLGTKARVCGI